MTSTQKVIKYFALAMAALLIFGIFSTILGVFNFFSGFFVKEDEIVIDSFKSYNLKDEIIDFDIETYAVNISVSEGEKFKVETNDDYVSFEEDGSKLIINEEKHHFRTNKTLELKLYIPHGKLINDFEVENGAGNINIDNINLNKSTIELGAGVMNVNNINVNDSIKIEGGAGKININNGIIHNLNLDTGVGETNISSLLLGNTTLESGVGKVDINIFNDITEYSVDIDKGLGNVKINGNSVSDGYKLSYGLNNLLVNSGIGEVNIKFK